jgi:cell division GTPase FtsZ
MQKDKQWLEEFLNNKTQTEGLIVIDENERARILANKTGCNYGRSLGVVKDLPELVEQACLEAELAKDGSEVVFSIAGGSKISLADVEQIAEAIYKKLDPKTKCSLSVSIAEDSLPEGLQIEVLKLTETDLPPKFITNKN